MYNLFKYGYIKTLYMKQPLILSALAMFALVGAVSIGGADSLVPETPETNGQFTEISPHQLPANVHVEKNGETIVEDKNVMLDGERVLTHLMTTSDDSYYNVISVGRDDETYDSTDDWHEPSSTESNLQGRYDEDVTNGMAPQMASLQLPDEEQSLEFQTTYRATTQVDVATTALEIEHDRYGDTDVEPYRSISGNDPLSDGGEIDYNVDEQWDHATYDEMDTFAATDFGRVIPLEEDDELTVTWEIIPQNPEEVEQE